MRVIIAGSRDVTDPAVIARAVADSGFTISEVVSGGARGVDTLGEEWARANRIPFRRFPADWDRFGRSAGYRRNEQMAAYAREGSAGGLLAVWDGISKGTGHMIDIAHREGLQVYVHRVKS